MKFLKELDGNRLVSKSYEKTYFNVKFHERFGGFMEALRREKLISESTKRAQVERGTLWCDCRRVDGVMLITHDNAHITQEAPSMIVSGTRSTLELFEHVLSRYATYCMTEDIVPQDVEIEAEYHESLNPLFWTKHEDGYTLDSDVRKDMLNIAYTFLRYLKMSDVTALDVIFTGSNANYNWTEDSDVDVHIIIDMPDTAHRYGKIVPEYIESKRRLWNAQHEIKIHDKEVEVYVQDEHEVHTSTGIFSLKDDRWVVEPHYEPPTYDTLTVRNKVAKFATAIDELVTSGTASPKTADEMMDTLKRYRRAGLKKQGEFSVENLVFKYLRSNGYLEKLSECKRKGIDTALSAEDEEWWKD